MKITNKKCSPPFKFCINPNNGEHKATDKLFFLGALKKKNLLRN